MARALESAKRVFSGTFGEVWLDGEKVAETYSFSAKYSANKTEVPLCGQMVIDTKTISVKGTGSVGMYRISSRMAVVVGEKLSQGLDPRFTILEKLADPDAYGAERIAFYNCSFDDVTLADWAAGELSKIEAPFTFTKHELLEEVEY